MAKGAMAQFMPPEGVTGSWMSGPYSSSAYEEARKQANMYTELAKLYERYGD